MTATQQRQRVADQFKLILGRNLYSQDVNKRECCFTPYKDGKYYSDCSSAIRLSYKRADIGLNNIGGNTVSMYQNAALKPVACSISKGIPTNIPALRVGDMLLFAGNDKTRSYADFVGHVEMIYKISGSTVTLCGHGSGNPSTKEMVAYCKSRQNTSASTSRGNRGLLKVVRAISDDSILTQPEIIEGGSVNIVNCTACNIRFGPGTQFGIVSTTKPGNVFAAPDTANWTPVCIDDKVYWISTQYTKTEGDRVIITNCTACNIRTGSGTQFAIHLVAKPGQMYAAINADGWTPVILNNQVNWISGKYTEV